jgi:hypothetical protein
VRREIYAAYRAFVAAFGQGAEKLKATELPQLFLVGSFPPALPFVGG